jgi:hypothetical protein
MALAEVILHQVAYLNTQRFGYAEHCRDSRRTLQPASGPAILNSINTRPSFSRRWRWLHQSASQTGHVFSGPAGLPGSRAAGLPPVVRTILAATHPDAAARLRAAQEYDPFDTEEELVVDVRVTVKVEHVP